MKYNDFILKNGHKITVETYELRGLLEYDLSLLIVDTIENSSKYKKIDCDNFIVFECKLPEYLDEKKCDAHLFDISPSLIFYENDYRIIEKLFSSIIVSENNSNTFIIKFNTKPYSILNNNKDLLLFFKNLIAFNAGKDRRIFQKRIKE